MPLSNNILLVSNESSPLGEFCADRVQTASNMEDAMRCFDKYRFGIVILDMRQSIPGILQLLEWFQTRPSFAIFAAVFFAGDDNISHVRRLGVGHITQVSLGDKLDWEIIFNQLQLLAREKQLMHRFVFGSHPDDVLVGQSTFIRSLAAVLPSLVKIREPLWISGASGSGKSHLVKLIVRLTQQECITVNLADRLPDPGEFLALHQAIKTGCLLKIDNLEQATEHALADLVNFLDVLESKKIPPLFILTTTEQRVADWAETHTSDLSRRLAMQSLHISPLAERREDIAPLIEHFLMTFPAAQGVTHLTDDALAALMDYEWPGQIGELWQVLSDSSSSPVLTARSLPQKILKQAFYKKDSGADDLAGLTYAEAKKRHLDDFNRSYLSEILRKSEYNITVAAEKAGMDRSNFKKILRRNQLDTE